MSTVNDKKREEIERKLILERGAVKLPNGMYLIPDNNFTSGSKEIINLMKKELKMNVNQILQPVAIESIRNLVSGENETIAILMKKSLPNNVKVFELSNMKNGKSFVLETSIDYSNANSRRIFVGVLASAIEVRNVNFINFLMYDYQTLSKIM